jgi:acyl carrier protein
MHREAASAPDTLALEVRNILADTLGLPLSEVDLDAILDDSLGLDSFRMIEVSVALEASFGLVMPDCAAPSEIQVRTVRDLVEFVRANLNGVPRPR